MFHIRLEHFTHTPCWQQKKERNGKNSENVNAHHKLTPHSRDYVLLRRLIKNNAPFSFLSSLHVDCFAFLQQQTKASVFDSELVYGYRAPLLERNQDWGVVCPPPPVSPTQTALHLFVHLNHCPNQLPPSVE